MSRFVQKVFAISLEDVKNVKVLIIFIHHKLNMVAVKTPIFERATSFLQLLHCWRNLLSTFWQSLVEFCLLTSVCEAWQ